MRKTPKIHFSRFFLPKKNCKVFIMKKKKNEKLTRSH